LKLRKEAEPKEESTPDFYKELNLAWNKEIENHRAEDIGYIPAMFKNGFKAGYEHYLPLKEENKKLTELLELAKALKLLNESIRKDLQSELKNLREENERLRQ